MTSELVVRAETWYPETVPSARVRLVGDVIAFHQAGAAVI